MNLKCDCCGGDSDERASFVEFEAKGVIVCICDECITELKQAVDEHVVAGFPEEDEE